MIERRLCRSCWHYRRLTQFVWTAPGVLAERCNVCEHRIRRAPKTMGPSARERLHKAQLARIERQNVWHRNAKLRRRFKIK